MESYDRPSSTASGTAAVRQREQRDVQADQDALVSEERAARVAELREQYQHGTYQVDPAELSSDIVEKHLKK